MYHARWGRLKKETACAERSSQDGRTRKNGKFSRHEEAEKLGRSTIGKNILEWHLVKRTHGQLRSVCDMLPTPTNLATWCMRDDPSLDLRSTNLKHMMSSCSVVICSIKWRIHRETRQDTLCFCRHTEETPEDQRMLCICKLRKGCRGGGVDEGRLLGIASDWLMVTVLNSCKQFPRDKAVTNQIPDIVKLEDRIEEPHEWKMSQGPRLSAAGLENDVSQWKLDAVDCGGMHVECLADCGNNWYLERDSNSLDEMASLWVWKKREEQWKVHH